MALQQQILGNWDSAFGNATHYMNPITGGRNAVVTGATIAQWTATLPVSGTFRNLRVSRLNAFSSGDTAVFTVMKGSGGAPADTALTVTVDFTNQSADNTTSVAFTAGDTITFKRVTSGNPSGNQYNYSLEWEPDTADVSIHSWGTGAANLVANLYDGIFAGGALWASAASDIVGVDGNLTMLCGTLSVAPGVGTSRTFTVYKNGVAQDGSGGTVDTRLTISGTDTVGTVTFALPLVEQDLVSIQHTVSGVPATARVNGVATFVSDEAGIWNLAGSHSANISSGAAVYTWPIGDLGTTVATATEADFLYNAPIRTFYVYGATVLLDAPPGSGKSWTQTLRLNTANTAQTVTIADAAVLATLPGTADAVEVVSGDVLAVQMLPTNTPDQTFGQRWVWKATAVDPLTNTAPVVDAGPDQAITIPTTSAVLVGSATDDGLPGSPGALTYLWTQISGPAPVTFEDDTDPTSNVSFIPAIGTYVLQLAAYDGELTGTDTMTITLGEPLEAEDCPSGAWGVEINGVDRTEMFKLEQVDINYTLGSPGNLRCLLVDKGPPAVAVRPAIGHVIIVTKGVRVFTGKIVSTDETSLTGPNVGTGSTISAVDYQRALSRRRFTKNYDPYAYALPPVDGVSEIITERISNYTQVVDASTMKVGTIYPHLLVVGDRIKLSGVSTASPTPNDIEFEITATPTGSEFHVLHALSTPGQGGKVSKLVQINTIFDDLLPYLAAYGITLNVEANGPWIVAPQFSLETLEGVINYATQLAGWVYRMTPYKVLQVFTPGTVVASFTLSIDNSNMVGPAPQARTRKDYANALYVKGGRSGEMVTRRSTWIGDGVTTVFPLEDPDSWQLANNGTHPGYMIIDGTSEPLTELYPGSPSFQWQFDVENKVVHQDPAFTVQPAGTIIEFTYQGPANFTVYVTDAAAIAANGGEIEEDVFEVGEDATIATATALGQAELLKRTQVQRMAGCVTFECLVLPGTVIPVDNADRLMDDDWLTVTAGMRSMDAKKDGADLAKYTYQLLEEGLPTTWVDFWKDR